MCEFCERTVHKYYKTKEKMKMVKLYSVDVFVKTKNKPFISNNTLNHTYTHLQLKYGSGQTIIQLREE